MSVLSNNGSCDAVIVGSGPNGLAAAIRLAREGLSVIVFEAKDHIGGGAYTAELTLPGFRHDVFSAIHPLAAGSPFLRTLPLDRHGLEWIHSPVPLAHPLDDGTAVLMERSVKATAANLGNDAASYRRLLDPLASHWDDLASDLLRPFGFPRHPLLFSGFGLRAICSAAGLAETVFGGPRARALFAGLGAHSIMPLGKVGSAAIALVMCAAGHAVGWPMAKGGSRSIAEAMARYLESLGGVIVTNTPVASIEQLPKARVIVLDLTPRQVPGIVHDLSPGYRSRLKRYRYGPAAFKVEWALDGPIPWRAPDCSRAATVHLGGTLNEIAHSESKVCHGKLPEKPFVILTQQSLFDSTRSPDGKHTAGAYCHVPNGSEVDMTEAIEAQVERFAPGFRDRILRRHKMSPLDLEEQNPNLVGGDIGGGVLSLRRLLRTGRSRPYSTPVKGLYICSSSTPPGAGVHGMCGYNAALEVLQQLSSENSSQGRQRKAVSVFG